MAIKNPCKGKTGTELSICKRHHTYLDKMLKEGTKTMHGMLDDAYKTGALSDEFKGDNYLLPKAIITIWSRKEEYAPLSPSTKKEVKNLEKFL